MLALYVKNIKVITCLLSISNQNARDDLGNTPFMIAAANGDIPTMELLIDSCNNTMVTNF
jgi:ankyrin repeat protein